MKKAGVVLSVVVIVLCLVTFPLSVPSGAILASADRWYVDHTPGTGLFEQELFEFDEDEDLSFGEGAGGSMDHNSWTPTNEGFVFTLPFDFSPGQEPKEENYSENSYMDPTISVVMTSEKLEGAVYHVAHVKIADGSQLRTALAGPFGTQKTNKPSTMAQNNYAVVAINGDYYNQRDGGYITRQGEVYRKKLQKNMDNLLIDEKGDFHIVKGGDKEGMEVALTGQSPIVNSFTFGPALIVDGTLQEMPEKYLFNIHRNEPRAAIGQIGPLEYVLVAVDGRSDDSTGITALQLAQYMETLGCTQAFNLDGGNSATLIFHNNYFNTKSENAERSVSDIIYFATAAQ